MGENFVMAGCEADVLFFRSCDLLLQSNFFLPLIPLPLYLSQRRSLLYVRKDTAIFHFLPATDADSGIVARVKVRWCLMTLFGKWALFRWTLLAAPTLNTEKA